MKFGQFALISMVFVVSTRNVEPFGLFDIVSSSIKNVASTFEDIATDLVDMAMNFSVLAFPGTSFLILIVFSFY